MRLRLPDRSPEGTITSGVTPCSSRERIGYSLPSLVSLAVLVPFTLLGHEFARRILFDGIGLLMGFGAVEVLVRAIGRNKRLGFFLIPTGIV